MPLHKNMLLEGTMHRFKHVLFAIAAWVCAALVVHAQDADPSSAPTTGPALGLQEAVRLAIDRQPLLEAQSAAVAGAHQRAVADAQLPDPKLSFGVQDFPIDTRTAYSLRKDDFTMQTLDLMQDFPRGQKRRLRGERGQREAEMAEQELEALRLSIPRDAALAWVDVWWPERAIELARVTAHAADLQAQAVEIAYRTGRATQADVLAARVDFQVVGDEVADWAQRAEQARSALSRWIGADAERPVHPDLPTWAPPPDLNRAAGRGLSVRGQLIPGAVSFVFAPHGGDGCDRVSIAWLLTLPSNRCPKR